MSDNEGYAPGYYLETLRKQDDKFLKTYLTKEEIKILFEFLSHQYIDYENLPLLELVRKISSIANEDAQE